MNLSPSHVESLLSQGATAETPDFLLPSNYMGQGVAGNFQHIDFLVAEGLASQSVDSLVCGSFLVAMRTQHPHHTLGMPTMEMLSHECIYLVRVLDSKAIPETDSSTRSLCIGMMDHRLKTLQQHNPHALAQLRVPSQMLEHVFSLLECELVGTFYKSTSSSQRVHFSGDVGHISPAVSFHLYRPDEQMMELIVNGTLTPMQRIDFGLLRVSESQTYLNKTLPTYISMLDIRGKRTAMFGKTRMGKSNVVKLIVQGMLDVTTESRDVGQLIFDVNGEYANSNPQDGADAIATAYPDRCTSYFLANRGSNSLAKLLRFNFYERTADALGVMRELLPQEVVESDHVNNLMTCRLPAFSRNPHDTDMQNNRRLRKVMLFWTLLCACGFESDEQRLKSLLIDMEVTAPFNPGFSQLLRLAAYQAIRNMPPPGQPNTFMDMVSEFMVIARFSQNYPNDPSLRREGQYIFDSDEEIMIAFLLTPSGSGPFVLRPCLQYHSPTADNFVEEILTKLNEGSTVIVDLGSANEQVIRYFAKSLSIAVFREQERKFVNNHLNNKYIQIYFEEAHMIFPPNSGNIIDVYSRFAKEGAKFNIGIVYCTQSPSTINRDLLSQTENFFIGHLSSDAEAAQLGTVQFAFKGIGQRIMMHRTPGLLHVLTHSHRYVVPMQANRYNGQSRRVS